MNDDIPRDHDAGYNNDTQEDDEFFHDTAMVTIFCWDCTETG